MNKKLLLFIMIIAGAVLGLHGQNINHYFTDMPSSLLPTLESSSRQELIENYESNPQKDTLKNFLGGKVRLLQLDTLTDYISIQTASNSRFEMKILKRKDNSDLLMIINTVCAPICSSYVHFYDKDWKEVKVDLPPLKVENWLQTDVAVVNGVKVKDLFKTSFIELKFNNAAQTIEVTNNSLEFLGEEEEILVEPYFSQNPISLKWNGEKWYLPKS